MNKAVAKRVAIGSMLALLLAAGVFQAQASISGETGTQFNLVAREGFVSAPDGGSIYSWGYALDNGLMQYPGPTLILNQGDTVTVTLKNELPQPAGNLNRVSRPPSDGHRWCGGGPSRRGPRPAAIRQR